VKENVGRFLGGSVERTAWAVEGLRSVSVTVAMTLNFIDFID
jgi:hypothetical protein